MEQLGFSYQRNFREAALLISEIVPLLSFFKKGNRYQCIENNLQLAIFASREMVDRPLVAPLITDRFLISVCIELT